MLLEIGLFKKKRRLTFSFPFVFVQSTPFLLCCFSLRSLSLVANSASIFSCFLSFILQLLFSEISSPFPRCSSLNFCLLSLFLSCSLLRCSSVKLPLLSLSLSCSLWRYFWHCSSVKLRLLSLSLSHCSSLKFCLLSLALCRSRSR